MPLKAGQSDLLIQVRILDIFSGRALKTSGCLQTVLLRYFDSTVDVSIYGKVLVA